MTSFNYLRSSRRRFGACLPERAQSGVCALIAALLVVAGICTIEQLRLQQAVRTESLHRHQYLRKRRAAEAANLRSAKILREIALVKRLREIQSSGSIEARRLVQIAADLPPHAWLSSVSHDAASTSLEGRAKDVATVAAMVRGLSRQPALRLPAIELSTVSSRKKTLVEYTLRYANGKS